MNWFSLFKILLVSGMCLMAGQLLAKAWTTGYYVNKHRDTLHGEVKYRKIDVPRALFRDVNGQVHELRVRNTLAFATAKVSYERKVFKPSEIGWADTFFMMKKTDGPIGTLHYGKIMTEGCGCDGVPYTVEHRWVLTGRQSEQQVLLELNKRWRIINKEDIIALLAGEGIDVEFDEVTTVPTLRGLLTGHNP